MTVFVHRFMNFFIPCSWFLLTYGCEVSPAPKGSLPLCDLADSSRRFVFVSTLDGKLTAINANNNGGILWTIHPGSDAMLSSSIHKLELSNFGHLVRMIPSLGGGLYKFNGENIELIPVTSDHLLQSSLRYSDDLVISGGKEIHTFGVCLNTGDIIYECSMKRCGNISHSRNSGEILIIQKKTQTIHALETRTGTERWNFSVSQLDLKLVSECPKSKNVELNYHLKIIIPEGIVYATDVKDHNNIFWKQKFSSPVVSAWELHNGQLIQIDLFSNYQEPNINYITSPSLYIGMYDKQLYIQESIAMLKKRQELTSQSNQNVIKSEKNYPIIPWKPVSASVAGLGLTWQQEGETENVLDEASQIHTTALSVLYASPYVDGSGFFLYAEDDLQNHKESSHYISAEEEDSTISTPYSNSESNDFPQLPEAGNPVVIVGSFWYYWKEVLIISVTSAVICNLMFARTYLRWKFKKIAVPVDSSEEKPKSLLQEKDSGIEESLDYHKEISKSSSVQDYISRYLTDFEPVACLGKGGFGVVFEAKNKIDDCHYAIKRILLPRRQESRVRVLREVKALAKLDHHHIVRYFNAWTECPPSGWQEKHDKLWFDMGSDISISSGVPIGQSMSTSLGTKNKSWVSQEVDSHYHLSNSQSSNSIQDFCGEFSSVKNDISDSFVVFAKSAENSETNSKNVMRLENSITGDQETDDESLANSRFSKQLNRPVSLNLNDTSSVKSESSCKIYLYIQMQLCQRHSLKDWLNVNSVRDYNCVLNIFEQILQAVEHVHLHGLIHRDLKPSNIFFSLDNQIKVGDFGLATAMIEGDGNMTPTESVNKNFGSDRHTAQVGTHLYMSREQLLGKSYNYKVDIYSLGLILFELLVPFSTQMERIQVLQDIKKDKFPASFKKAYKKEYQLLRLMLSDSPEERPTTYGIRARLPLKQGLVEENWHFELPIRKHSLSNISSNVSVNKKSEV